MVHQTSQLDLWLTELILVVFKGPQSSIYGSNALAGLINITYTDPTPFINGKSLISIGSDNNKLAGFAIGGPLFKNLLFRFAFQKNM